MLPTATVTFWSLRSRTLQTKKMTFGSALEANDFMEKHPSVQVIKFGPGRIGLRRNKDGKIESVCFGY